MSVDALRVESIETASQRKEAILSWFQLYRDDPNWVPPLISDEIKHLDPDHNPFFEHAEARFFCARRNGRIVGTIMAIADEMHLQIWGEPVGFFGRFETVEDYVVAEALFDAAGAWLADRGRNVMRGPMDLNINDELGMFIEGERGAPVIMMPYNKSYYPAFLEQYGFKKVKDLYAYKVDIYEFGPDVEGLPQRLDRLANIAETRYNVRVRPIRIDKLDEEVALLKPIHRAAWNKNWGAIPMTDAEYDYLAEALGDVADPDLCYLAFIENEPVGCFISLPDYNQVLKRMNGRLFPLGWLKFLWYKRKINALRVLIMGVLEEHRLKGIEALFYREACRVAKGKGYEWAEMSWILEDNYDVIRGIERIGGEQYRTYRVYDLPLGDASS